jgi:phytoene dehydrogenase-like protein
MNHTIVVGGGLAGMAAATYIAREGQAVTLLERSHEVGGRAITDDVQGFALNRGIHALYTGGPASEVLRELGVCYTAGTPRNVLTLSQGRLHAFPSTPNKMLSTTLLSPADKLELLRVFTSLGRVDLSALARVTVRDWIERAAHRPKVRQLLAAIARPYMYSQALDLVSADAFLEKLRQSAKYPIHYVDGGWQSLAGGLRDAAEAAGVDVRSNARVVAVRVENARASAVRLAAGPDLPATAVVLAVPPAEARHLLGGNDNELLESRMPAPVATLDVALRSLPMPSHEVVFDLERPVFVSVQSIAAKLAPAGGAVLHAFKQLDPRGGEDEPAAHRRQLEALLDTVQPGWRDVAIEQRYLPRIVASHDLPLASRGGLAGRCPVHSPSLANVLFAGDWVGPRGFLIDAALASAREAARLAAGIEPAPALRRVA